jgi:hypothetical protein
VEKVLRVWNSSLGEGEIVSHPEIFILEREPFFQKKLKISKGFHLFELKMVLFDFILFKMSLKSQNI